MQASFSVANFLLSPFYGRAADSMSIKAILLFSNIWELAGNTLYVGDHPQPITLAQASFSFVT